VIASAPLPKTAKRSKRYPDWLENGAHLNAAEFLRRYEAASLDAREKLATYRRAGVAEYVLWRTADESLDWWALEEDEYQPLGAGGDGFLRSRVFPGLWLDTGVTGR
jgi:hypothetical protein